MTDDAVLEHWNNRAQLQQRAGSDDLIAKKLEINALSNHIKKGMAVAEFGCGNGTTAIELLTQFDIELNCFDFSPAMIEAAQKLAVEVGVDHRVTFSVCDVRSETLLDKKFDLIYTERMIINLPDWEAQARAIRYLISHLRSGGRYLMCENSQTGLDRINSLRIAAGLDVINPPWHNVYLNDEQVEQLDLADAKLVEVDAYSSSYYFLSRVVNAWLSAREGRQPVYDAPVNQLALQLPPIGDFAQGKLWVFEKNPV